eukprot:1113410_1
MSLPKPQGQTQQQQTQQGQTQQQQTQQGQTQQNAYVPQQQQIQGFPQMQQQQQYPMQMQGFPQMQQMQQPYSMQGFNNNSNAMMPQQMQYPPQGMANLNTFQNMSRSRQEGFHLIEFESTRAAKTIEEGKDKETETKLKLAAVIITICDGSTFDSLFSTVKQDAGDGSRVAVYSCSEKDIGDLVSQLTQLDQAKMKNRKDDLHLLLNDLSEIEDPTCVAINYECCSGCNDSGFTNMSSAQIIKELEFFLSRKYLVMYSDFSLKALIKAWNEVGDKGLLGPNPLMRTGDFHNGVTLHFNPFTLKTCVSSQLQSVGELCPDQDHCTVHCMSSTVKYSIKKQLMQPDCDTPYDIQILTIAQFDKHDNSVSIQVPDFDSIKKRSDETDTKTNTESEPMKTLFGDAGHVVLDYDDGNTGSGSKLSGKILLSMTHWCELVKLGDNVTDDVLFQVAAKNLGKGSTKYQQMQATYQSMGGKNATGAQQMQQQQWVSQQANMMVQQQAPCNNMMNSNIGYYGKGGKY